MFQGTRIMRRVLVIAPHADDEVEGPGATIAKHVASGDEVTVCIIAFRRDNSPELQIQQAKEAKSILGYKEVFFLGLEDEYLDGLSRDIIKPLEKIYKNILPEIVYTCSKSDTNQDHRGVSDATMTVCRYYDKPPRKLLIYNSGSAIDFVPNYYNVVNESCIDAKLLSLGCYGDQVHEVPHPRCEDSMLTIMNAAGLQAGVPYAEPFILVREINP
jgi:N-acetylglucosamine malate deacetylase 1